MSAFPPSAAIVSAHNNMPLAPSGNCWKSLSAALIHETGRVFASRHQLFNVVICDNGSSTLSREEQPVLQRCEALAVRAVQCSSGVQERFFEGIPARHVNERGKVQHTRSL